MNEQKPEITKKSPLVENEERTLAFWREKRIFQKTLDKESPKGEFVFFEGPPTANGKPGIHHLEAKAFKDAIPRYKTMQGFHVRRKGGWDTHGLPVELQVEKELGLKSKKEIETYGIEAFNKKCRESVWKYVKEWEDFTSRAGHFIDLDNPYVTYDANYVESLWSILKKVHEKELLYKDYKVVPWCPRCGTGLSSHELAQGYEDVKDLSVTAKFKLKSKILNLKSDEDVFVLAWTTTPWTLPGNVGLAVGEKISYSIVVSDNIRYIVARDRVALVFKDKTYEVIEEVKGKDLVGLEYEPLYPFLKDNISGPEKDKLKNAFKVYSADFVTTTDGTGVVHTAVMYGTDDFDLGTRVGLPKYHLVKEDGNFTADVGFLAGKFVKDPETDVMVIKDLAGRGLLFSKEKYAHSYPHCWRCHTPLIYFARDSWYIKMSELRSKLIEENKKINWEPSYIKEGRFGEWLNDVKDWAISRERYWGTPLPVWQCVSCKKHEVIGSFDEIRNRTEGVITKIILVRHGESEKNVKNLFSCKLDGYPLTKLGESAARTTAETLSGETIDAVYTSPVLRAKQTAEIIARSYKGKIIIDEGLREVDSGLWDEKRMDDPDILSEQKTYKALSSDKFYQFPRGQKGESWQNVEERMVAFVREIISKHKGGTVLVVSHEGPLAFLMKYLKDLPTAGVNRIFRKKLVNGYAQPKFVFVDSTTGKEFNPHRPRIDDVVLSCGCGGGMKRVKEVVDVWFDSGAMPFAQDADLRGTNADKCGKNSPDTLWPDILYPADFISEAIDQTRGWFYTMHAVGALLGKGRAYKNVICLGHILDKEGKKMSKSLGNVVDPNMLMDKYGADALRFWMYSVNQPGEPKNFDEKTVDEVVKKVFNLASNVLAFYQLYADKNESRITNHESRNVLDVWIIARLNQLTAEVTSSLEGYKLLEPTRAIRDYIADLSQWYLRRSRDRFKGDDVKDKESALLTTRYVLLTLSKLMAPFTPFFAEHLYQTVGGEKAKPNLTDSVARPVEDGFRESVHLENWPQVESRITNHESQILEEMEEVRKTVSLALEARAKANIKVRQPLASLKFKSEKLKVKSKELTDLIKDEVNVKEVLFDSSIANEVELDVAITSELKEEGDVRELARAIQELRKSSGLNPGELAALVVSADETGKAFIEKAEAELMKSTQLNKISFTSITGGSEVTFDSFTLKISIEK